jgi:hypothetical protein
MDHSDKSIELDPCEDALSSAKEKVLYSKPSGNTSAPAREVTPGVKSMSPFDGSPVNSHESPICYSHESPIWAKGDLAKLEAMKKQITEQVQNHVRTEKTTSMGDARTGDGAQETTDKRWLAGDLLDLTGLMKRHDLNDRRATCIGPLEGDGRVPVRVHKQTAETCSKGLDDGKTRMDERVRVRPQNMRYVAWSTKKQTLSTHPASDDVDAYGEYLRNLSEIAREGCTAHYRPSDTPEEAAVGMDVSSPLNPWPTAAEEAKEKSAMLHAPVVHRIGTVALVIAPPRGRPFSASTPPLDAEREARYVTAEVDTESVDDVTWNAERTRGTVMSSIQHRVLSLAGILIARRAIETATPMNAEEAADGPTAMRTLANEIVDIVATIAGSESVIVEYSDYSDIEGPTPRKMLILKGKASKEDLEEAHMARTIYSWLHTPVHTLDVPYIYFAMNPPVTGMRSVALSGTRVVTVRDVGQGEVLTIYPNDVLRAERIAMDKDEPDTRSIEVVWSRRCRQELLTQLLGVDEDAHYDVTAHRAVVLRTHMGVTLLATGDPEQVNRADLLGHRIREAKTDDEPTVCGIAPLFGGLLAGIVALVDIKKGIELVLPKGSTIPW